MSSGGCGCGGSLGRDGPGLRAEAIAAMDRSFKFLGMPGSVSRFSQLCELKALAVRTAEKADRARVLGFPEAVVEQCRADAVRYRDLTVRGLRSLRATVSERLSSRDWQEFAAKLPESLPPGQEVINPRAQMDDLLAEARRQLLDSPLPAGDAGETFETVQRAIEAGRDGLTTALALVVEALAGLEEVLERDTFGREAASPSTAEYIACTLAATAFLIASGIGCSYIPFCWCCIFPLLLLAFLAWINGCESIARD